MENPLWTIPPSTKFNFLYKQRCMYGPYIFFPLHWSHETINMVQRLNNLPFPRNGDSINNARPDANLVYQASIGIPRLPSIHLLSMFITNKSHAYPFLNLFCCLCKFLPPCIYPYKNVKHPIFAMCYNNYNSGLPLKVKSHLFLIDMIWILFPSSFTYLL